MGNGHIDSVEVGTGTGRSPLGYSTDVIQRNTLQSGPRCEDTPGGMTFHWEDPKAPEPVCMSYGINNPMREPLFGQGTALPVPPRTDKQSIRLTKTSMYCFRARTGQRKVALGGSSSTLDSGAKATKLSSPTRFTAVTARRKAVLQDSHLRSACSRGSNGGEHRASRMTGRSQEGTRTAGGGRNRRTPLRNHPPVERRKPYSPRPEGSHQ
ncbi:hypothetical protein D5F01_LYC01210 [Larimichthys crocea]|uniref:Uncharacterized protein n=1 Tax=Larimichthys crocea TaxID=215358 RepID=A0A6G0JBS8_LARCR|nr:hypothetical protein D5F01_LYC01210 [Larimichthys crocea]